MLTSDMQITLCSLLKTTASSEVGTVWPLFSLLLATDPCPCLLSIVPLLHLFPQDSIPARFVHNQTHSNAVVSTYFT